ncbi:alpha/beta hydrolase [Dietzia psychralcaliphila]|uniref:Alpha/beta hydrolase n=1 Tax=Dietzia psychralcaliphila TaxID=139021 RepID=A0AAD0NQ38_9ACTN|nr:alpha/beta hydrolase [Dietzia psychralcaliphila]AWH95549.1 alpha/beta hydrolase [Dietzia psychralcaliphila]PTM88706.1 alpha-beta hydrolase superfamily lysophospholipase [Dietzia psychralcaliphila]
MASDDAEQGRVDATFRSGGVECAAWVYRPDTSAAPGEATAPAIVMAHGLGCVRDLRLPAYAERFRDAGFVVVVFDYRHFGASGGEPRQLLDIGRQLDDWRSALSFARSLPGVDPDRVIAWGTSFSGGHVITLAGTGERLAGIVAQVPHVSGPAAVRATGLRSAIRLTPAILDDLWRAARHREPRYVPLVGLPGEPGAMTSPDADPAVDRLVAASGLRRGDFPEYVAARILIRIGMYSPIRHARRISCPALVQIATRDAITPAATARAAADRMPRGRYLEYPCEHFDPYVDPYFERIVADQLEFCTSVVGPAA